MAFQIIDFYENNMHLQNNQIMTIDTSIVFEKKYVQNISFQNEKKIIIDSREMN